MSAGLMSPIDVDVDGVEADRLLDRYVETHLGWTGDQPAAPLPARADAFDDAAKADLVLTVEEED